MPDMMRSVQIMVLDEADQMLDMGFRPDLIKILAFVPPKEKRQACGFDASPLRFTPRCSQRFLVARVGSKK